MVLSVLYSSCGAGALWRPYQNSADGVDAALPRIISDVA
jgi:hypothetical protein